MMYKQLDIFNFLEEDYKIKKPLRLIELFGGIGAQAKALENLNVPFEHYKLVEFDKYCIQSYNAIHNTNFETQDITKISATDLSIVDTNKYDYIMCYSYPCTDLSLAGDKKGMEKGSGTRSSLLWEVERILKECNELPQILLMENVPQVHSKQNLPHFKKWIEFLESLGYKNFYQDLNAKDFGIPQNRNRCFMISLLGNYHYTFPQKQELKLRLKDLLESDVDEKYYLSDKMLQYIVADNDKWTGNNSKALINKSIASTINTGEGSRRCDASNYVCDELEDDTNIKLLQVGSLKGSGLPWDNMNESTCRVYSEDGMSPTLDTMQGGHRQPKILIKNATKQGYLEAEEGDGININSRMHYQRGNVQKDSIQTLTTSGGTDRAVVVKSPKVLGGTGEKDSNNNTQWKQQNRIYDDNIAITLATSYNPYYYNNLRIRKLTPRECFRLMGFDDADFDKAAQFCSNTQLYKQAGNSIVVSVLMSIFKQLF